MEHTGYKSLLAVHRIKQFVFGEGWFISFRFLAMMSAFLGHSSLSYSKDSFQTRTLILILSFIIYNLLFWLLAFFKKERVRLYLALSSIADLLFVFLIVFLTGGISSPFIFLFYLIIPLSTYSFSFAIGLIITSSYTVAHIIACILNPLPPGYMITMGSRIFYTFILGLAIGILAEKDRRDKRRIEKLNDDLKAKTIQLQTAYEDVKNIEQYLFNIIESIHGGIITVNRDGQVTTWNQSMEDMTGIHRQEVLNKSLSEVFPSIFQDHLDEDINKVIKGELVMVQGKESRYEVVKGAPVLINLDIHQLKDSAGNPLGAVLVAEDVTERVNLERRLAQSEKLSAIGKLASGLAHEIGTPLSIIRGYAERLILKLEEKDVRRGDAEKIKRHLDRISKLIRQLLIFARHSPLKPQEIQVNEIIRSVAEMLEPELQAARIDTTLDLQENLPLLRADPDQLYQVFFNIVVNAKQAMQETGGRLIITSGFYQLNPRNSSTDLQPLPNNPEPADFLSLGFSDTGSGIQPNDIKQIFDPFFTTKDVGEGSGLGLAICHGIVTEHGGWIEVESKPGEGSSFQVILPFNRNAKGYA